MTIDALGLLVVLVLVILLAVVLVRSAYPASSGAWRRGGRSRD
jgi:hypothetical protein